MSSFGSALRALRIEKGYTLDELAALVGTSKQVLSRYENDLRAPKISVASRLASALGVSLDAIMNCADAPALPSNLIPASALTRKSIPLIGNVAAGEPIFAEESYDTYLDVDGDCRVDYALRVQGDSMFPTYQDGDIIYIRQQPDVAPGQVAVVLIDDAATLKHIYHDHRSGEVTLVSDNPAYPPMHYQPSEDLPIRILGVPVGFTRMYASARNQRQLTARDLEARAVKLRKSAGE